MARSLSHLLVAALLIAISTGCRGARDGRETIYESQTVRIERARPSPDSPAECQVHRLPLEETLARVGFGLYIPDQIWLQRRQAWFPFGVYRLNGGCLTDGKQVHLLVRACPACTHVQRIYETSQVIPAIVDAYGGGWTTGGIVVDDRRPGEGPPPGEYREVREEKLNDLPLSVKFTTRGLSGFIRWAEDLGWTVHATEAALATARAAHDDGRVADEEVTFDTTTSMREIVADVARLFSLDAAILGRIVVLFPRPR